eukprot:TRINITY_DN14099_c0_g1_i2.p1 TRINITY_DN14099_c0_g1~~TRINITY_DN14099_c0_g1_i2.p1  ORF type:complete len:821 (-),score=65.22 TRINITY_DN14099_c0_g1_i2:73-2535(-)
MKCPSAGCLQNIIACVSLSLTHVFIAVQCHRLPDDQVRDDVTKSQHILVVQRYSQEKVASNDVKRSSNDLNAKDASLHMSGADDCSCCTRWQQKDKVTCSTTSEDGSYCLTNNGYLCPASHPKRIQTATDCISALKALGIGSTGLRESRDDAEPRACWIKKAHGDTDPEVHWSPEIGALNSCDPRPFRHSICRVELSSNDLSTMGGVSIRNTYTDKRARSLREATGVLPIRHEKGLGLPSSVKSVANRYPSHENVKQMDENEKTAQVASVVLSESQSLNPSVVRLSTDNAGVTAVVAVATEAGDVAGMETFGERTLEGRKEMAKVTSSARTTSTSMKDTATSFDMSIRTNLLSTNSLEGSSNRHDAFVVAGSGALSRSVRSLADHEQVALEPVTSASLESPRVRSNLNASSQVASEHEAMNPDDTDPVKPIESWIPYASVANLQEATAMTTPVTGLDYAAIPPLMRGTGQSPTVNTSEIAMVKNSSVGHGTGEAVSPTDGTLIPNAAVVNNQASNSADDKATAPIGNQSLQSLMPDRNADATLASTADALQKAATALASAANALEKTAMSPSVTEVATPKAASDTNVTSIPTLAGLPKSLPPAVNASDVDSVSAAKSFVFVSSPANASAFSSQAIVSADSTATTPTEDWSVHALKTDGEARVALASTANIKGEKTKSPSVFASVSHQAAAHASLGAMPTHASSLGHPTTRKSSADKSLVLDSVGKEASSLRSSQPSLADIDEHSASKKPVKRIHASSSASTSGAADVEVSHTRDLHFHAKLYVSVFEEELAAMRCPCAAARQADVLPMWFERSANRSGFL